MRCGVTKNVEILAELFSFLSLNWHARFHRIADNFAIIFRKIKSKQNHVKKIVKILSCPWKYLLVLR